MNVPPSVSLFHFDFYEPLPIQIEVSDSPLTSDAGLLPLRQFDERIGLTKQFAAALHDPRDPALIDHTFTYTYGLSTNPVLQRASEELLAEAVRLWDETHEPQRLFAGFWSRAGSWPNQQFFEQVHHISTSVGVRPWLISGRDEAIDNAENQWG